MKKFLKKYLEFFIVFGLLSIFTIFYLWDSIVITIFPGHTGVYFKRFLNRGTVIGRSYEEGVHFILPWNKMYIYDVRIQKLKQTVEVLSQNGLTIKVIISVRYFILREEAPLLHQKVGKDYENKVIIPSTISSVREVMGKYLPEQLYTTARHIVQDEILVGTIEETGRLPIIYSDMIIELIKLPDMINTAIENKLRQQQEFLAYKFKILKATEEKKRKIIEASGIKLFQEIITQSLSEPLLKWQGIQATKEIAKSHNTKIIIIGGENGLPIILNTEDNGSPPPLSPDIGINQEDASPDSGKETENLDLNEKDLSGQTRSDPVYEGGRKIIDALKTVNNLLDQDSLVYDNHMNNAKP